MLRKYLPYYLPTLIFIIVLLLASGLAILLRGELAENKATVRRFLKQTWNKGNLVVVDEICATNYVNHHLRLPDGEVRGTEDLKQFVTLFRKAFPKSRIIIVEQIAQGNKVVTRWRLRATNKGELMGKPPTGQKMRAKGITVSRVVGGKIEEEWDLDERGLLQHLGFVP